MPDVFWDRIEPHSRDPNVEEGLAAKIADPLWLLTRQWQLGEFRGEDAASPIDMSVRVMHVPLASFRNETDKNKNAAELLDTTQPLESRVEAERIPSTRAQFNLAAELGLSFLRLLQDAGLKQLRSVLRLYYKLRASEDDLRGLQQEDLMRVRLLESRSLNGLDLMYATSDEFEDELPLAYRADAIALWQRWRDDQLSRFDQPGASGETWYTNRLEHQFSIATASDKNSVVLSAKQYAGGRLDWYSFDLSPNGEPHDIEIPKSVERETVQEFDTLAVPLTYSGMPAARYWEFEDGTVYFGGIEAGPADIGRLLVAEFATVYSDDWFLIPVRLPMGSMVRTEQVTVRNTFGETHAVKSCAVLDSQPTKRSTRNFSFFELSGDTSAKIGATPWLALVPSLATSLHSTPLERVNFVRDEAGNLAWAIEEQIETAVRRSLTRRMMTKIELNAIDLAETAKIVATDVEEQDFDAAWRYRLQTQVPPYWIPLVPERSANGDAQVMLRRARMLAWSEILIPELAGPKGSILQPDQAYYLYEEEIPRGGVQVTRQWQVARGRDGRLHIWLARNKRPGRGERGSGLKYDRTLRK